MEVEKMPQSSILRQKQEQGQVQTLPPLLSTLYSAMYASYDEASLKRECDKIFKQGVIHVKECEKHYLEEQTRLQSQSLLWFKHRVGCITASKSGDVSRARKVDPSCSLAKAIVQERHFDSSKVLPLNWGITNESVAREAYLTAKGSKHESLECQAPGLHIHKQYSYLAASPDGIVSCKCCGEGLIEIKCPYKFRDSHPKEMNDPLFFLQEDGGELRLSRDHVYYTQIQGQLEVCNKQFCDFICWTTKGIHIKRILRDPSYFEKLKPSLDHFFKEAVLPLILCGSDFDAGSNKEDMDVGEEQTEPLYCWCQEPEFGRMVGCDNQFCEYEWCHYSCVGIKRKPQGKWYCSEACKSAAH